MCVCIVAVVHECVCIVAVVCVCACSFVEIVSQGVISGRDCDGLPY